MVRLLINQDQPNLLFHMGILLLQRPDRIQTGVASTDDKDCFAFHGDPPSRVFYPYGERKGLFVTACAKKTQKSQPGIPG